MIGVDLVEAQFRIAAGASLASLGLADQRAVGVPRGYAVQARIVTQGAGTLTAYKEPSGPGVRVDACGYLGYAPPPQFVQRLRHAGFVPIRSLLQQFEGERSPDHARQANQFGCPKDFAEFPYPENSRDIDVLFVGNFHATIQRDRLPWLARLAKLSPRWKVLLTSGEFGDDYRKLLLGDRVLLEQDLIARQVGPCVFEQCEIAGELAFGLHQLHLERARIDLGQQLSGFDDLALAEQDAHELAVHSAAHRDHV